MSIPGRDSTAVMLVRAGFVVVLVPVNVSGFCLVLARGWHGRRCHVLSHLDRTSPAWSGLRWTLTARWGRRIWAITVI
jgi:hypothetical protein